MLFRPSDLPRALLILALLTILAIVTVAEGVPDVHQPGLRNAASEAVTGGGRGQ